MQTKEILNYVYNNYENIDINKEEKLAYEFINIFINNELYKKNKNQNQIEAFITIYAKLKIKENNIDFKVETTNPSQSKRKLKVLRYIDTFEAGLYGSCDYESLNIQLTNYLIRALYRSDKKNFASLIETINHELNHATYNKKNVVKHNIITKENYYALKFKLMQHEAPIHYHEYYKNFEEEIRAFEAGYQSVVDLYQDKDYLLSKDYENKVSETKAMRCRDFYDVANINCFEKTFANDKVRESLTYEDNKAIYQIEFNEKGQRRRVDEIIDFKYKQLDNLNKLIMMYPDSEYLLDVINNNKTEEVFNEMGYVAILRDDYFIDCINESNKKDALKMIDYGINYQYKRIDDNNKYCKSYMDKLENEAYLKGLIKKLEAKKAEIYGYNKGQITK